MLYIDGSNLLEVLPDPERVEEALDRVPLRVHQDIVVTSQMFVDGDDVILLPAATRYEQEGGGTSTTTERQIAFSPQVADPPGEARSEWRIFGELASRVRPGPRAAFDWDDDVALRAEIAELVPMYAGIEDLERSATPCSTAVGTSARVVPSRHRRDGAGSRCSTWHRPSSGPTSGSCPRAAASSSTRWSWPTPIR